MGLNYWWTPNFVFKLSFHHVDGNRFAGPDPQELAQAVASGNVAEEDEPGALRCPVQFLSEVRR